MPESTVAGLATAEDLSDDNMFLVSQPEAYNPFTQSPGDTRKVTLPKHVEYLEEKLVTKKPLAGAQVLQSHLAFAKGKELLGTKAAGAQANLAALKTYNEGLPNQVEQVEIGSETEHLNLNTDETGEFKDHISVDTKDPVTHAAKKEIIAYMSDVNAPFGYVLEFDLEPTALEMALWRVLPLHGQVVLIAEYQRLCNRKYCGDALNGTAAWWYKTSDPQGLVRDVNGAYMRVLDHRGLFSRAAGQNSLYKCANDTPYNGGSIGDHIGDAFQMHGHAVYRFTDSPQSWAEELSYTGNGKTGGATIRVSTVAVESVAISTVGGIPRAGSETRPASISLAAYIRY
jgi:hypothetical protein